VFDLEESLHSIGIFIEKLNAEV